MGNHGSIDAVGRGWFGVDVGEQDPPCDAVDTVCSHDQVELVPLSPLGYDGGPCCSFMINVDDGGVDVDLSSQLFGHFGEALMKMCAVDNPPR